MNGREIMGSGASSIPKGYLYEPGTGLPKEIQAKVDTLFNWMLDVNELKNYFIHVNKFHDRPEYLKRAQDLFSVFVISNEDGKTTRAAKVTATEFSNKLTQLWHLNPEATENAIDEHFSNFAQYRAAQKEMKTKKGKKNNKEGHQTKPRDSETAGATATELKVQRTIADLKSETENSIQKLQNSAEVVLSVKLEALPPTLPSDETARSAAYSQSKAIGDEAIATIRLQAERLKQQQDQLELQKKTMEEQAALIQQLQCKMRRLTRHRKFDMSKLPADLLKFQQLSQDPRVRGAIEKGPGHPSLHTLAAEFARTGDRRDELRARCDALVSRYEEAIQESLATPGWFKQCYRAVVAGNNAFREVYDQVWNGFILKGEAAGLRRYRAAVARLRVACDTSVTKQRATDVLTLYEDAARVKPRFDATMEELAQRCVQAAETKARREYLDNLAKAGDTRKLQALLRQLFKEADTDQSGTLDREEVRRCLERAAARAGPEVHRAARKKEQLEHGGPGFNGASEAHLAAATKIQRTYRASSGHDSSTNTAPSPNARFTLEDPETLLAALPFDAAGGGLDYDAFADCPAALNLLANTLARAECDRILREPDYEGDTYSALFDFQLTVAPGLKKIPRIIEKSQLQHTGHGDVSCVKDVVRCMLVVQRMDQVALAVEQLLRCEAIVVVRIKERFVEAPSAGGWRDLMVSFYLREDAQRKHICELQVAHETMLAARKGLPGHVVYGRVRNAMELLERHRGGAAALEALALADLVEAVGPGVAAVAASVPSHETTAATKGYGKDGQFHFEDDRYRAPRVPRQERSLQDKAWLSDALVGSWCGVTTDPDDGGRVTRLDLRNMALRGDLPPSLKALERLAVLNLTGNDELSLDGVALKAKAGPDKDEEDETAGDETAGVGNWSRASALPLDETSGEPHYVNRKQCAAALEVIGMSKDERDELKQRRYLVQKYNCPDALVLWRMKQDGVAALNTQAENMWFPPKSVADSLNVAKWGGLTLDVDRRVVELEFERCTMLTDSLGDLSSLKTLNLTRCQSLESLPERVGDLSNLQTLNLFYCSNLETLPERLGDLSSLQTLSLYRCSSLKALPERVGDLFNLQTLTLKTCTSLKVLPDRIGDLSNLQTLDLSDCWSLTALPERVGDLSNLQTLNLTNCKRLDSVSKRVKDLPNLQALKLDGCGVNKKQKTKGKRRRRR